METSDAPDVCTRGQESQLGGERKDDRNTKKECANLAEKSVPRQAQIVEKERVQQNMSP